MLPIVPRDGDAEPAVGDNFGPSRSGVGRGQPREEPSGSASLLDNLHGRRGRSGSTMGIDDIRAHNQENIMATLANLATAAERSH
jgi:hypothetical protein